MSRTLMNNENNCPEDEILMEAALARAAGMTLSEEQRQAADHAIRCTNCQGVMAIVSAATGSHSRNTPVKASCLCLDDNTLAEYFDGVMAWDERVEAESHLAACPRCLNQLSDLHTLMVAAQPAPSLPQLALAWLRDGFKVIGAATESFASVPLQAAPVLDGMLAPRVMAWDLESSAGPLRVTVQHDRDARATLRLSFSEMPTRRGRVQLRSEGQLLESRALGGGAAVEFAELDIADYEVEVEAAGERSGFAFSLTD